MGRRLPKICRVYWETTQLPFLTCFRPYFCYKTSEIQSSQRFVILSAICRDRGHRLLAFASSKENLMLRAIKVISVCAFVLLLCTVFFF